MLVITVVLMVALSGVGLTLTPVPVAAQGAGSTILSAVFSIYVTNPSGETVNIRRITAPWNENTVTWNNFGSSLAPLITPVSFPSDVAGWHSVDVTELVQGWHAGTYPNYGLALDEGDVPFAATLYNSSEFGTVELRPRLDVTYTVPGAPPTTASYTIQRPSGTVQDAYVWALNPNTNYNYETLYTGDLDGGGMKYALLQFVQLPTAVTVDSLSAKAVPPATPIYLGLGLVAVLGAVVLGIKRRH
ncbi:MAG: DNRLRE domain-containing protein [Anaerolineae bacterium]